MPVFTGGNKRGQDTKYGFLSPLDSPYLPLRCDSLRSRSEMRGAHRDVWCSKGTPLMEAELFAAERCRSAPSGRALLCAAVYVREIQGITASQNLPDARNRAPVPPFRRATEGSRVQRRVWGVKRGKGTIGALSHLVSAARRRHPPAVDTASSCPSAAIIPSDKTKAPTQSRCFYFWSG